MKPNDAGVYVTLAAFYNRRGEFDKTIEALHARAERGAEQPGSLLHDRDLLLGEGLSRLHDLAGGQDQVRAAGNEAIDKAIKLKSDYPEALTYKGLLLRVQANLEKDPGSSRRSQGSRPVQRSRPRRCEAARRAGAGE